MKQYLDALRAVLSDGELRGNRTGIKTLSLFGLQIRMDLQNGFPLLTTKKMYFKGIVGELVWMLQGQTNIQFLQDNGIHIWDGWADKNGDLGPVYGKQWRDWNGNDQVKTIIGQIKHDPESRRIILTNWNVAELKDMSLPPCHILAQFYVRSHHYLDCSVYQRSGDMFLGIPFDIASYAIMVHLFARWTDLLPGKLIYNIGDAHIYENHIVQVKEQLKREPRELPELHIVDNWSLDKLEIGNFIISGYKPYPTIKGEVAL